MAPGSDRDARLWSLIRSWSFLAALATLAGLFVLNYFANLAQDGGPEDRFAWSGWSGVLIRGIAPEIMGTLLIYLAIDWLLRRQHELFSESAINQIGDKVAERVFSRNRLSFDDTLESSHKDTDVIRHATSDLWIARKTGRDFLKGARDELISHLRAGRSIKLVVTSPKSIGSTHLLFGRNDFVSSSPFSSMTTEATNMLRKIFNECREPQKMFELRYCPYALPATVVLSDPLEESRTSHLTYRLSGFLTEMDQKREVNLETDQDASPEVIKSIIKAYREVFYMSSKIVVLPFGQGVKEALRAMMPEFWGLPKQFVDPAVRYISAVDSDNVFIVWFEEPRAGTTQPYVRFGSGNLKATEKEYAVDDGDVKNRVSQDTFRELMIAWAEAVALRKLIIVGNIGPLQLGQVEDSRQTDFVPSRMVDPVNVEFYSKRLKPGETSVSLTICSAIDLLVEDYDSHVFLDLTNDHAVTFSSTYQSIMNHERTTVLRADEIPDILQDELDGSIRSVSFTRLAPKAG